MYATAIILAASSLFSLASASSVGPIALSRRQSPYPVCANPCLSGFDFAPCKSAMDLPCLCKTPSFLDTSAQCIYDNCPNPADVKTAQQVSVTSCHAFGVDLTSTYTPTQSRAGASASASGSAASSPSASSSSASVSASSAAASVSASASSASASISNTVSSASASRSASAASASDSASVSASAASSSPSSGASAVIGSLVGGNAAGAAVGFASFVAAIAMVL